MISLAFRSSRMGCQEAGVKSKSEPAVRPQLTLFDGAILLVLLSDVSTKQIRVV